MKNVFLLSCVIAVGVCVSGCSSSPVGNEEKEVVQTKEETGDAAIKEPGSLPAETIHSENHNKIAIYLEEECQKAFSAHYELLDFTISDYEEKTVDGKVEATFGYQVVYKNFEKDPDTVAYIKEAKEKGDPHYQQLYDEYGEPKEMNFQWKAVIDHTDSIVLYTNVNPKGVQWEKAAMSDFVLSK